MSRRVVVTGLGIISCLGNDAQSVTRSLYEGNSGISTNQDQIDAGMIWVNSEHVRHLPTPFGGVKASGIGRDGGDWSFEFYMEQKHIGFATGQHKIMQLGK